ncbi:MAG: hypothetical protein PVI30_27785 [Myxococcales bacterium]
MRSAIGTIVRTCGPRMNMNVAALLVAIGIASVPSEAFAITFNMPSPGTVTVANVGYNGTWYGKYIVYKRADNNRCYFWSVNSTEDVTINGTNETDVYLEFKWSGSGSNITYPEFCGYDVIYTSVGGDFNVNLGGGNDVAFVYNVNMTVRGEGGNDLLRHLDNDSNHPAPFLRGGSGNDYVYSGRAYGGSGNDVLCSVNEDDHDHYYANGGSGTDTFCGGDVYYTRRLNIEHYQSSSRCPDYCEGLFGW